MAIFIKMTKEVAKNTGLKISTDNAKDHKDIKEELNQKKEEIKMTRMTGSNVKKNNLQNHASIKAELEKTKETREMSKMAGTKLTQK
jgi:hypothetical protein